ncbi:MAG: LPS export ABC transporter ATP-binding protein [Candidatus Competibacterales bacterium]|nr:LPS export ABC transporter ATP-binding protein [Candidatus Competibacterales bacterium]
MNRLQAVDVVKHYRGRQVVDHASLSVASGEVVGLLGPNGAGKTTCFYMMVGLIGCDAGQVLLNERDITRLPMHARARLGLGYLPQEPSVFRKLSVRDNVLAILETRQGLSRAERLTRAEELLEELHVGHLRDQPGISLSGGERRRVEIARALATEPRFILLDEPFAGVDPLSVADIQRIIEHLRGRGIGVLITDHNVRETLGICQRAYILSDGRVIAEGGPGEILSNPDVRRVYLGEAFRL